MSMTMKKSLFGFVLLAGLVSLAPAQEGSELDMIDGKTLNEWLHEAWWGQVKTKTKPIDPFIQERALAAIARFGSEKGAKARPYLLKMLERNLDTDVFLGTLSSLQAIGIDEKQAPELLKILTKSLRPSSSLSLSARIQVVYLLSNFGPLAHVAIPTLSGASGGNHYIRSPAWKMRRAAAYTLGRISLNPTKGPDWTALRALSGRIAGFSADPCAQVRLEAILALGSLGQPQPADPNDPKQKAAAAAEAGRLVQSLRFAINRDNDLQVKLWAHALLALYEPPPQPPAKNEHLEYLYARLDKSTDTVERSNLVSAIGAMGGRAAEKIPLLIELLSDKDDVVANAAAGSLSQLGVSPGAGLPAPLSPHLGKLDELAKSGKVKAARIRAIQILGGLNEQATDYVSTLVDLLAAKDDKNGKERAVAHAASVALGRISADLKRMKKPELAQVQIGRVAEYLKHPDPPVRCLGAQTLMLLGDKAQSYIPNLLTALKTANTENELEVMDCMIIALASFGDKAKEALPYLELLLMHKEDGIKDLSKQAINAIKGVGPAPKDPKAKPKE